MNPKFLEITVLLIGHISKWVRKIIILNFDFLTTCSLYLSEYFQSDFNCWKQSIVLVKRVILHSIELTVSLSLKDALIFLLKYPIIISVIYKNIFQSWSVIIFSLSSRISFFKKYSYFLWKFCFILELGWNINWKNFPIWYCISI